MIRLLVSFAVPRVGGGGGPSGGKCTEYFALSHSLQTVISVHGCPSSKRNMGREHTPGPQFLLL